MDEQRLTEIFASLGADDPASWARSQLHEGIPQLARFLFLREAWSHVTDLREGGPHAMPGDPMDDSLGKIFAAGVSAEDLSMVVRLAQWKLLFAICRMMEGPLYSAARDHGVDWGLFQRDGNGRPTTPISLLHESVIETDPMRRTFGGR